MPSGRDSFRRNRVAPIGLDVYSTIFDRFSAGRRLERRRRLTVGMAAGYAVSLEIRRSSLGPGPRDERSASFDRALGGLAMGYF
jgi:hypothetical protein